MPDLRYLKSFQYEILTPQGRVDTGQTVGLVLPAVDGAIGFLARRAPLVAAMGAGRMTVHLTEDRSVEYFVAGGFAHVHQKGLTILAEQCIPATSLDREAAAAELEAARQLPDKTDFQRQHRQEAMAIAAAKLRLAGGQVVWKRSKGDTQQDRPQPQRPQESPPDSSPQGV
jgi:F-type H+-transporting ATPase subunit epsilon